MSDLGIISPDEQSELIDGEIILMAAQNPPHVVSTKLCYDYLLNLLKNQALVRSQAPIRLSDRSLPEPDISVVRLPLAQYYDRHPEPDDLFWIIEVSDATLQYDLTKKAKLYAKANIPEYWVLDAIESNVHMHREPLEGVYLDKKVFCRSDSFCSLAFPDIRIELAQFFPTKN